MRRRRNFTACLMCRLIWRSPPFDFSPEQQPNGMSTAERAVQVIELALRDGHCEFEWLHRTHGQR